MHNPSIAPRARFDHYARTRTCHVAALACLTSVSFGACGLVGDDAPASIGLPCVAEDELFATFSGFNVGEVNIAETPACGLGNVCLVHNFQGRVSCESGQVEGGQGCFTPLGEAVTVAVAPQLPARSPAEAVICSCRCDAPFAGDYCTCPSGMRCEELIPSQGDATRDFAGSYCVY